MRHTQTTMARLIIGRVSFLLFASSTHKYFTSHCFSPASPYAFSVEPSRLCSPSFSLAYSPKSPLALRMLGLGLVWAFIRGWQLTLVGVAIAPVFGIAMTAKRTCGKVRGAQ